MPAKTNPRPRPFAIYFMIATLLFLSLGACYGGLAFLLDPSGALLGMDLSFLKGSIFPDFFFPGLVLFVLFGLAPLLLAFGLLTRPRWPLFSRVNPIRSEHWAWTGTLLVGAGIIVFEIVELASINYFFPLQPLMAAVGVILLALCALGAVRQYLATAA